MTIVGGLTGRPPRVGAPILHAVDDDAPVVAARREAFCGARVALAGPWQPDRTGSFCPKCMTATGYAAPPRHRETSRPSISEADFQTQVVDLAHRLGWTVNHTYRGRTAKGAWRTNATSPGFPDLCLLRASTRQLVFLELKREGGKPTPAQVEWITGLQQVPGVEAYIAAPSDMEELTALLQRP